MKRSKYNAKPTVVDGIRFDSQLEAHRYGQLKLMEKAGAIWGLQCHNRYSLFAPTVGGENREIGKFEPDFTYYTVGANGAHQVVEDTKGIITPMAKWKIRHFEAQYGTKVRIITKQSQREAWEAFAQQRSA